MSDQQSVSSRTFVLVLVLVLESFIWSCVELEQFGVVKVSSYTSQTYERFRIEHEDEHEHDSIPTFLLHDSGRRNSLNLGDRLAGNLVRGFRGLLIILIRFIDHFFCNCDAGNRR
jgi:hypothetical protein